MPVRGLVCRSVGVCLGLLPRTSPRAPPATPQGDMQPLRRVLVVTGALVLLLVVVAADEPTSAPDPTPPAEGQAPEPVSHGKLEASGDSVTPVSPAGAERLLTDDVHPGALDGDSAGLDTLNSGAFNLDPLAGDTQSGPAGDVTAQSNESQESVDHDTDSEEVLVSPGM